MDLKVTDERAKEIAEREAKRLIVDDDRARAIIEKLRRPMTLTEFSDLASSDIPALIVDRATLLARIAQLESQLAAAGDPVVNQLNDVEPGEMR